MHKALRLRQRLCGSALRQAQGERFFWIGFKAHVKLGVLTALLLGVISAANAEAERCVPAADGGWHCGKEVSEADAAPLPERQSRTLPPVMLIDPARFGEGDIDTDVAPQAAVPAPVAVEAATAATPVAEAAEVAQPTQVSGATETTAPSPAASGNFVVQLAVARSPRGFDALLAKLGADARNSQRRQLANGSWVLLIGNFNSIAQARSAIPGSLPGAFVRDISTLNFR